MTEQSDRPDLERCCFDLETVDLLHGRLFDARRLADAVIAAGVLENIARDIVVKTINALANTKGQVDSLVLGLSLRDLSPILEKRQLTLAALVLRQVVCGATIDHQTVPQDN